MSVYTQASEAILKGGRGIFAHFTVQAVDLRSISQCDIGDYLL